MGDRLEGDMGGKMGSSSNLIREESINWSTSALRELLTAKSSEEAIGASRTKNVVEVKNGLCY